jgi:hypothetical protein
MFQNGVHLDLELQGNSKKMTLVDLYSSPPALTKRKSISVAISTKGKDELVIFDESGKYVTVYVSELASLISQLERFEDYFSLEAELPKLDVSTLTQQKTYL